MALLHCGDEARGRQWQAVFASEMPEIDFRCAPDAGNISDIRYLVAWTLTSELVSSLPNLETIFSVGAGVDQLDMTIIPEHIRVVRMIEPGIIGTMTDWIVMAAMFMHRDMPHYIAAQRVGQWSPRHTLLCRERAIGIMGLGELGRAAATALGAMGFRLHGWSRSPHRIKGMTCYAGEAGLDTFLGQSEILICLLPLTDETRGILCGNAFGKLPRGARLINAARGGHLVQDDLLEALETGQISAAMLDVTDPEPLPSDHPFHRHPAVFLTPHIAGVTRRETAINSLIANVRALESGGQIEGEIDRSRGY